MIIHGTAQEFSDTNIRRLTDIARVRKSYSLHLDASKPTATKALSHRVDETNEEMDLPLAALREMEFAILGIMALRGAS